MKKIGICGVYGNGPEFSGGQPVKVRMVTDELIDRFGIEEIDIINTYAWINNPFKLLLKLCKLIGACQNIIIMPAHNGIKVFSPIIVLLNILFRRKIHYVVIGGWLPEHLQKNKLLKKCIGVFSGIYVETQSMKNALEDLGLNNIYIMNNFKKLDALGENEVKYYYSEPYKLCIFSRITKEKGVEDAINSVIKINSSLGKKALILDLYGQLGENYSNEFNQIIKNSPNYINYCGVEEPSNSVQILRNYFIQLFPTRYKTEGIPGSIIDSYYAGTPVLASKWSSFNDVVKEGETGIGFEFLNVDDLADKLMYILDNPKIIINMRSKCIERARYYSADYVMKNFIKHLE